MIPARLALAALAVASLGIPAAPVRAQADGASDVVLQARAGSGEGRAWVEIRGDLPRRYRLGVAADGSATLEFPGARLELDTGEAAAPWARASLRGSATLALPPGSRLLGVEAGEGRMSIAWSGGAGPATSLASAAGGGYRLGVGDKLRLNIYGDESLRDKEMRIVGDGTIAVPYVGDVQVAGLTVTEAADALTRRLSAGYLVDPKVSLEVVEHQSQWVNVSGQVEKPGRYYLEGPTRLVDIIAQAGGLKRDAGTRVRLARPGAAGQGDQVFTFTRESLYLSDDPATNPLLRSGDTVTVSSEEFFFIKGEVKSPGRYALDQNTTILKAISLAGGFEQYANQKKIELLRKEGEETIRMVINIERIENRKAEDVPLRPGDIINVRARFL